MDPILLAEQNTSEVSRGAHLENYVHPRTLMMFYCQLTLI